MSMAPSVGDMMAVAMAAAGMNICDFAGRVPCETDYLAVSGATFPASVTAEQMERFNHATRFLPDEEASAIRYEAISAFWHQDTFDRRMAEIERRFA